MKVGRLFVIKGRKSQWDSFDEFVCKIWRRRKKIIVKI